MGEQGWRVWPRDAAEAYLKMPTSEMKAATTESMGKGGLNCLAEADGMSRIETRRKIAQDDCPGVGGNVEF